jgi:hypothetical protein
LSVGALIEAIRVKEVDGRVVHLPGSHWGSGVVLLDRDHLVLRMMLFGVFALEAEDDNPGRSVFTDLYNHLLRAFCFARTYARLCGYGTYKGYRTHHVPFVHSRYQAIEGK